MHWITKVVVSVFIGTLTIAIGITDAANADDSTLDSGGAFVVIASKVPSIELATKFSRFGERRRAIHVVHAEGDRACCIPFVENYDAATTNLHMSADGSLLHRLTRGDVLWLGALPRDLNQADPLTLKQVEAWLRSGISVGMSLEVFEQMSKRPRSDLANATSVAEYRSLERLRFCAETNVPTKADDRLVIELRNKTELVLAGRWIWAQQGTAVVRFPESASAKPTEYELRDRPRDIVALQRGLKYRLYSQRPLQNESEVANGTLFLGGGGRLPRSAIDRFVELAGGPDGHIIVLPTALPEPLPKRHWMIDEFEQAGATNVTILPQRVRADIESDAFLDSIRNANGIWFGGGRQWRFVDAYEGTAAVQAMRGVLERGGVIGGSSAGASIQADYLARGNPLGNAEIMADGYERGFAFLPGTVVDQHFSQRKRLPDLQSVVARHPELIGIGIDESTGIFVSGHQMEVVGTGDVYVVSKNLSADNIDSDRPEQARRGVVPFVKVSSGERFDLKRLKRVMPK